MAEANLRTLLPENWPILDEDVGLETAQAQLDATDLGDGLPLVPPTVRRLSAMLEGVYDPSFSHGFMAPLFGELTTATVAYQCVLAGCRPAELPVVLTAAIACLDPDFNLLGLMTTTGSAAVATLVHGPIVDALGMNASINCLGPGNRANASIGRAVSLALGHPFGATGVRMTLTMARELHLTGAKTALLGICAAGGLGAAAVLEGV